MLYDIIFPIGFDFPNVFTILWESSILYLYVEITIANAFKVSLNVKKMFPSVILCQLNTNTKHKITWKFRTNQKRKKQKKQYFKDTIERENDGGNKNEKHRNQNDKKNKNNYNNSSLEKPKTSSLLGNSMLKKLNGYLLTKMWDINTLSKFHCFQVLKSGAWLVMSSQP